MAKRSEDGVSAPRAKQIWEMSHEEKLASNEIHRQVDAEIEAAAHPDERFERPERLRAALLRKFTMIYEQYDRRRVGGKGPKGAEADLFRKLHTSHVKLAGEVLIELKRPLPFIDAELARNNGASMITLSRNASDAIYERLKD